MPRYGAHDESGDEIYAEAFRRCCGVFLYRTGRHSDGEGGYHAHEITHQHVDGGHGEDADELREIDGSFAYAASDIEPHCSATEVSPYKQRGNDYRQEESPRRRCRTVQHQYAERLSYSGRRGDFAFHSQFARLYETGESVLRHGIEYDQQQHYPESDVQTLHSDEAVEVRREVVCEVFEFHAPASYIIATNAASESPCSTESCKTGIPAARNMEEISVRLP